MAEAKLTIEQLRLFFEERPSLRPSSIGQEAGLGLGYLNKVLKGEKPFSDHVIEKILPVIDKYGYGR